MRFSKNGDENDDDMDGFMDEGDYENIISQQNALEGFHLHILEKNLKTKILFESSKLCKNIFWFLYSDDKKIKKIKKAYNEFIEILDMKE